jgi:hypothetical protein
MKQWARTRAFEKEAYRKQRKARLASPREVIEALYAYYLVTGIPAFQEAARIAERNLDTLATGKIRRALVGDPVKTAVAWMDERRRQHKELSIRRAAALAARTFVIPGKSPEGVVERLETAYRQMVKDRDALRTSPRRSKKRAHVFSK